MKKVKVIDMKTPDCAATLSRVVETAEGVEGVNVNYATGEITYGPTECVDEGLIKKLLHDAGYNTVTD